MNRWLMITLILGSLCLLTALLNLEKPNLTGELGRMLLGRTTMGVPSADSVDPSSGDSQDRSGDSEEVKFPNVKFPDVQHLEDSCPPDQCGGIAHIDPEIRLKELNAAANSEEKRWRDAEKGLTADKMLEMHHPYDKYLYNPTSSNYASETDDNVVACDLRCIGDEKCSSSVWCQGTNQCHLFQRCLSGCLDANGNRDFISDAYGEKCTQRVKLKANPAQLAQDCEGLPDGEYESCIGIAL